MWLWKLLKTLRSKIRACLYNFEFWSSFSKSESLRFFWDKLWPQNFRKCSKCLDFPIWTYLCKYSSSRIWIISSLNCKIWDKLWSYIEFIRCFHLPICFHNFVYEFFSVWAVERRKKILLVNNSFFSQFASWKNKS